MAFKLSLIGFGEAGSSFARAARWGNNARAYDLRPVDYAAAGVIGCPAARDAITRSALILSLVTADAALEVAREAALHIERGALFLDMNSVSPIVKREAAAAIEAAGAGYVDVAVMAPVQPQLMAVPLLLSGMYSAGGQAALGAIGFTNIRIVGDDVGRASTIKMLRSVMYKGVEALTAECLLACEKAGVTDEVLNSFGNDWSSGADYRLDRMMVHGLRRAAEMDESVQTLHSLGISPMLTQGTIGWQQTLGQMEIDPVPAGLKAKLAAISENMA